jgi:hypothetical protein
MRNLNRADYYARRELDQLGMAENARDGGIANIHRELAHRYAQLRSEAVKDCQSAVRSAHA